MGEPLYPVVLGIGRFARVLLLGGRLQITGFEATRIMGPLLVCSNHIGTIDPALIPTLFQRKLRTMAKQELFHGMAGFVVAQYGGFPVNRHSADRRALKCALEVLHGGGAVMLFPEGHRSEDGSLLRAEPGIAYLIRHGGAPVLPMALQGTEGCLPPGARFPRRTDVEVRFGAPFMIQADNQTYRQFGYQAIADLVMYSIAELLPPRRRGAYSQPAPSDLLTLRRQANPPS